ncbi:14168_t:CDS:1, partial [Racocetra persica]
QMEILKELFTKTNIAYIQLVNYEADDIIASFITQTSQQHPDTSFDIFTRDKDLLQLLSKNTNILKYISGKITLYTAEQFYQEYNFLPSSYVDYLSLIGDNIDNIEGVRGIGPVSANKLLQQFSTAENIFRNFATLSEPTNVKSLLAGKEELIYRNKKVISLDQSLSLPIVDCSFN